jgi:SAM-dependent methyltransferase
MSYPEIPLAPWPFTLPPETGADTLRDISEKIERLGAAAQYGWGHTIDFGAFQKEGLLGEDFRRIAGALDDWSWWPPKLDGMRVADVGCYTGGLSLLMAHRGANVVYAVDEIPENLAQCSFLAGTFAQASVQPILQSAYHLRDNIQLGSLDLILLSGVLYHMSDMLVGLHAMRELLKPGGLLLIQSSAIDDFQHSYANFGRFIAGRWWHPTGLCIKDMCEFMGFGACEVRFYAPGNCLACASRVEGEIPFKRGMNWSFENLRDTRLRSLDAREMAPAPHSFSDSK